MFDNTMNSCSIVLSLQVPKNLSLLSLLSLLLHASLSLLLEFVLYVVLNDCLEK